MMSIAPPPPLIRTLAIAAWLFAAPVCAADEPRLPRTAEVEEGAPLGVGRIIPDLALRPLDRPPATLSRLLEGRRAAVIAFTSTGCPLSTQYGPRLAAMEEEFRERGVAWVFINGVEAETEAEMREQQRTLGLDGPYLPDRDRSIAQALGARTTTEVFVLTAERRLVYRGAVDDQYGVGTALPSPRHAFLRDALEAALAGRAHKAAATWPPGCLIDLQQPPEAEAPGVTYIGQVEGILARNCIRCHHRDGAGPFPLDSPAAVRGRASMIEAVVRDGLMPPWPLGVRAADVPSAWRNDHSLSEADRSDLLAWLRAGQPLGDGAAKIPSGTPEATWTIGPPDRIFLPSMPLPAEGEAGGWQHLRVIVPTHLDADQWIEALEFRPVKRGTVTRAIVWAVQPGDPLPGPADLIGGSSVLGVYSQGCEPVRYDRGAMPRLRAGSLLIVDLTAKPMGQAMRSTLRLALRFAQSHPGDDVRPLLLGPARAGAGEASLAIERETSVTSLSPFGGPRCRGVTVDALLPGGETRRILDAPSLDFRWPLRLELNEPLVLPAGATLTVRGRFDEPSDDAGESVIVAIETVGVR